MWAVDAYIFLVPIGRARLIGIQFFGTDRTGASNRYGGENLKLFSGLFRFQLHIKIITCLEMVDRVAKIMFFVVGKTSQKVKKIQRNFILTQFLGKPLIKKVQ